MTTARKFGAAFAVAFVLLCVVGAMAYRGISRLQSDVAWVVQTQKVIVLLESLFSAVTDAVAAQRGFSITGDPVFRETYDRGIRQAGENLDELSSLTSDNPDLRRRVAALAALVAERDQFSRTVIDLRSKGQVEAVRSLIATGKGSAIHERIRHVVDEARDYEKALLRDREAHAEETSRSVNAIIALGSLLAILAAAAALYFVTRDIAGRRKAEEEMRALVDQLGALHDEDAEQLGRAAKSLRNSEARLDGIIQSAMDAIITVDEKQNIVLFNEAAELTFRCLAADAIGGPLERFIPVRFRELHRAHVESFAATGATSRRMGLRRSLFGLREDGEEFPIDASISHVEVDGHQFYTVILRDISERLAADVALERSHRELREAGERLRAILYSAMDAVITIDQDQRVVLFNEAAEKIFGCKAEEAIGGPLDRFIPARFRQAHHGHIQHFGETRVTTRMMGGQLALYGLRANGEEFPIDASISQATVEGQKLYTVILRDITERKRAQEELERSYRELRELSSAMHEVREAERLRIARELHDELAQWLTALKMDVSWLAARLPRELSPLAEKAEKMKGLVDTTVAAVRRIASDLRPVMLDDLGLVAALEHLLHDLSQRTGIVVTLDADEADLDFGEPLSSAIYRIAQEALTNVARHAQAAEVVVGLHVNGGNLVLVVLDNGRGFDPDAASGTKSYGVLGMRERAHTLGGSAQITRRPEGGTRVEVTVPVARYRGKGLSDGKSTAG